MDLSDLEFFVAVARAYPRLSATLAVLAVLVLVGANVRPSEEWALRHSFLFMGIRVCRAIFANAVKAVALLAEWRRDGSLAAVRAFFDRGRATDPSGPPSPAVAPVAPDAEPVGVNERGLPVMGPPASDRTTPSPSEAAGRIGGTGTVGGGGRRA